MLRIWIVSKYYSAILFMLCANVVAMGNSCDYFILLEYCISRYLILIVHRQSQQQIKRMIYCGKQRAHYFIGGSNTVSEFPFLGFRNLRPLLRIISHIRPAGYYIVRTNSLQLRVRWSASSYVDRRYSQYHIYNNSRVRRILRESTLLQQLSN